jgi:DNA polymerase-3 subunit delta'
MSWQNVLGQNRVKELLQRTLQSGRVAHAYLFSGPSGVGKDAMAIEFAKALNCAVRGSSACNDCASCRKAAALQHPNIQIIVALPVGKNEKKGDDPLASLTEESVKAVHEQLRQKAADPYHTIEIPKANFIKINSVREVKRQSALSLFEGGKKVFLILKAEDMNTEASNSILKTLEEPSEDTVLILTTSQRDRLLPTIVSRCQLVTFDPLEEAEIEQALRSHDGADPMQAAIAARLAGGSYARARELLTADIGAERESAVQFVRLALASRPVSLAEEIERLVAENDRVSLERWLRILQLWLHEALLAREGAADVPTESQPEDVRRFDERFPHADLAGAIESVESCIALLGKNVYLPLALTALAVELKQRCTLEPST